MKIIKYPDSNIFCGKIWKNGKHLFQYCSEGYRYFKRKKFFGFEFIEERIFPTKKISEVRDMMTHCLLSRTAGKPCIDWQKLTLSSMGILNKDEL